MAMPAVRRLTMRSVARTAPIMPVPGYRATYCAQR
jgi:hypothetical protein